MQLVPLLCCCVASMVVVHAIDDETEPVIYVYDEPEAAADCVGPFKYLCDEGRTCIEQTQRCDGNTDCYDGSDEEDMCDDDAFKEGCSTYGRMLDWPKCMYKYLRALGMVGAKRTRDGRLNK